MSAEPVDPAERAAAPAGPGALVVLLLGSTLVVMAGAVLSPVLDVVRTDLTLSGTAAGLLLTAHALTLAVASPVVGWLVDRHGPRGPLAAGLVVYGLAGGAGLVLDTYPALLVSRAVFGLGAAAVFTGTTVALLAAYRGREQERVMGWRSAATSVGGVAWPLVGGALGAVSWHAPFAVYLLGVPLGVATWSALPALPGRAARHLPVPEVGLAGVVRRPRVLGLCALLGTGTVLLYGLLVLVPLRLAELGIRSPFLVATVTAAMALAMTLAGLAYARAAARFGRSRLLCATYAGWAAAFAALAVTDSLAVVLLAQVVFGAGMGVAVPALTLLLEAASPPGLRGRVMALSGTAIFLGQFLSPLLLGPLADLVSVRTGFAAAAAAAVLVLLALLAAARSPRDRSPATPETVGGHR